MSTPNMPPEGLDHEPTPEEIISALFANMVIQNTNMALMFLGKVPHPQTGQPVKDLESAQMFMDQLEMLAYKTRGNLEKEEEQLLKQSLVSLRMTFIEELRRQGIPVPEHLTMQGEAPAPAPAPKIEAPKAAAPEAPKPPAAPSPAPAPAAPPAPAAAAPEKRFTKKY